MRLLVWAWCYWTTTCAISKRTVDGIEILALRSGQGINYLVTDQLERVDCDISDLLDIDETYDVNDAKQFAPTHILIADYLSTTRRLSFSPIKQNTC